MDDLRTLLEELRNQPPSTGFLRMADDIHTGVELYTDAIAGHVSSFLSGHAPNAGDVIVNGELEDLFREYTHMIEEMWAYKHKADKLAMALRAALELRR